MTRCKECGSTDVVDGMCQVDWCPSTSHIRKGLEVGTSIGLVVRWTWKTAVFIAKAVLFVAAFYWLFDWMSR